jgi:hypothetical protein
LKGEQQQVVAAADIESLSTVDRRMFQKLPIEELRASHFK